MREQAEADAAIVLKRERNVRLRQGDAAKSLLAVPVFGGIGAQELASRRRVEEKFVHRHRRAGGQGRRLRYADLAGVDLDAPCVGFVARARRQGNTRHRCDAGQRFTAKTQRCDRLEVARRRELRRGVTGDCELKIRALDAAAVVGDANQLDAAAGERDVDLGRTRVDAVLEQLLQRGGRPLDHLSRSDLIDQVIGQRTNRRHQCASPCAQCA